ncbi:DNA primase [Sporolactobacillus shoreicorticis]|uniref:DNA primase n=1 Tax=Sporolactobacillus shoreicorticis TaxID=1923877 RepID=A0ABW5S3Z8_9BACL|nr:DNA primase [Sporolactobacillus shoreicorticis]MCO7126323.1 DNA primase [Sporolactobacillus shoreicorticis]
MQLQEQVIEQIRKSLDIVDVIGNYVQLKKQGKNYIGLCPFHSERTPSFSVSPDKQLYHCFGCGAGGNLFTFIMEIEGMSFSEAAQSLADRANIDLGPSFSKNSHSDPNDQKKKQMTEGLELLTKFYHYLLTTAKYGAPGIKYLEERGFTSEMIERFRIGYAVESWDAVTKLLQKRGVSLELMERVGLIKKRGFDNKYFDRFRNRIIFPIFNMRGKTVAFGGRTLGEDKPKYLNSPESDVFHKGSILYGYHLARQAIRKNSLAVLLEGYVDVIRAHQAGVACSVASMGTSLTEAQAAALTRMADTIIICYDSDTAGIEASFRAAEMLQKNGKVIKIATMPEGLDPDDYIRKFGGDRFKSDVIGASQTLMTFKMNYLRRKRNLSDEGDRLLYIEDVLRELTAQHRAVERDHYLRLLSEEFSISLDSLKKQLHQMSIMVQRREKQITRTAPLTRSNRIPPAYEMAERRLLARMMRSREISDQVQDKVGGSFSNDIHQALAAYLYAYYAQGNPPDEGLFLQKLEDPALQRKATELSLMPMSEQADEKEIEDCMRQVIRRSQSSLIADREEQRKKAEQSGDYELAARLLSEMISVKKQLGHYQSEHD